MDWHYGSRWSTIATSTGTTTTIWIVMTSLGDVIDVDLHSDLSLEHCGSCCGTSFILQSKWKWRKHTMLKISNLEKVDKNVNKWKKLRTSKLKPEPVQDLIKYELHERWNMEQLIQLPNQSSISDKIEYRIAFSLSSLSYKKLFLWQQRFLSFSVLCSLKNNEWVGSR